LHALESLTVAVVDADALARRQVCSRLHALGYLAQPFASAAELLQAHQGTDFHALVLDLSQPDLDSFAQYYALIKQRPLPPLVLCSNQPGALIRAAAAVCASLGFTVLGTVRKPCAAAALSDLLYSLDENPIAQPF
jgi:CheY-like chemotaxis protein